MDMVHYVEHTSVAWGKVMPAKRGCFACPYGEALRLRRLRKILAQRSEGPKVRPASRRISHLNKVRKTIVALVALAPAGELGFCSDYLNL